ncbi:radical SAM protein [bacterium]|nr:radical SAM protein [candidate division CSSED10-310 bacterium]
MIRRRISAYYHLARALGCNYLDRVTRPSEAHFIPTWDCNMRCRTCAVWRRDPSAQLDTSGMIEVIRRLPFLDIVKIIGGEPFSRDDLTELVMAIQAYIKPYLLQIITNGVLTDKILHLAETAGDRSLHLRVSLDGFRARHEESRGRGEVFDDVVNTLRELVRLRSRKGFVLGINFNITDTSIDELERMIAFGRELGVDVVPGIPVTPFLTHVDLDAEEKRVIMLEDRERVRAILARLDFGSKRGLRLVERLFLRTSNRDIFANLLSERPVTKFPCLELRNLMYLFPNGDIVTCGLNHTPVGNLARQEFDDIWFGAEIEQRRAEVDACSGCLQAAVEIFSRLYGGALRPGWRHRSS